LDISYPLFKRLHLPEAYLAHRHLFSFHFSKVTIMALVNFTVIVRITALLFQLCNARVLDRDLKETSPLYVLHLYMPMPRFNLMAVSIM
jgi:hypothetical protein